MAPRDQLKSIARNFAALAYPGSPFLSIYLDTTWDDQMKHDRVRLFLKNELAKLAGQVDPGDAKQLTSYVLTELPKEAKGLVVFACRQAKTFSPHPLPVSFQPRIVLSRRPYIRPLIRAFDENKTALAVHLHAKKAEIHEISLGDFVKNLMIESDVPQKVEAGGWSQMRFQRHVEAHLDEHLSATIKHLIQICDRKQMKYVYLFGPEEISSEMIRKLPKRLREIIQPQGDLSPNAGEPALRQKVTQLLAEQEQREEKTKLERLQEISGGKGEAALGIDQTLEAVNQSAIRELLISSLYTARGWECPRCRTLGRTYRDQCPKCSAAVIATANLDNDLEAKVLLENGKIEEIIDNESFDRLGGVGAFLRFQLPT